MAIQTVDSFMTKHVVTLSKKDLVREAIQIMAKKTISCIVIVDKNKKPVGVVTERDLVKRVLQMNVNPHGTEISVVMSSPVITVTTDADIFDVMITMQKHNFRRVIVVDKEKRLVGLVTQSDLFRGIKKVQAELETINNQMRRELERLKNFTRLKKV
jgi:CBS domain-containing protein